MKYNLEWLFIGFVVFWIMETLMIFTTDCEHTHPFLEISIPFFLWGICSMLEYQKRGKKYG